MTPTSMNLIGYTYKEDGNMSDEYTPPFKVTEEITSLTIEKTGGDAE